MLNTFTFNSVQFNSVRMVDTSPINISGLGFIIDTLNLVTTSEIPKLQITAQPIQATITSTNINIARTDFSSPLSRVMV